MKRYLLLIVFLSLLCSCALSQKDRWATIDIRKDHWPEDYYSWTYKRGQGQNLVWAMFGNDNNGVIPWFKGEPWPFWKWWLRNHLFNFKWYIIGYSKWREGDPYASKETDHLEYCYVRGDWESDGFVHIGVKPQKRSWFFWKPYFGFHSDFLSAWIGWGRRGQFKASIKR